MVLRWAVAGVRPGDDAAEDPEVARWMFQCENQLCTQKVLLPYECDFCGSKFCDLHQNPDSHDCAGRTSCPGCGDRVSVRRGCTPAASLDRHYSSGQCSSMRVQRFCPAPRCKTKLYAGNDYTCRHCSTCVCIRHRDPQAHDCASLQHRAVPGPTAGAGLRRAPPAAAAGEPSQRLHRAQRPAEAAAPAFRGQNVQGRPADRMKAPAAAPAIQPVRSFKRSLSIANRKHKEAEELYLRGNGLVAQRSYDHALQAFLQAARLLKPQEDDVLCQSLLTKCWLKAGHCQLERAQYNKCVQLCSLVVEQTEDDSTLGKAWYNRGKAKVGLQQYEAAADDFGMAASVAGAVSKGFERTVTAELQRAQGLATSTAPRRVQEGLRRDPDNQELREGRVDCQAAINEAAYIDMDLCAFAKENGNAAFRGQRYNEAVQHYTEALKRGPSSVNPEAHTLFSNRAACYTKLGALNEGLADAEECIKLAPNFIKGYLRKGHLQFCMKEFASAIGTYQEGLRRDPDNQELREGRMDCKAAINEGSSTSAWSASTAAASAPAVMQPVATVQGGGHQQAVPKPAAVTFRDLNQEAIAAAGGIRPLVQLLGSSSSGCQETAARALALLASRAPNQEAIAAGAIPALQQLLGSSVTVVRQAATAVLRRLPPSPPQHCSRSLTDMAAPTPPDSAPSAPPPPAKAAGAALTRQAAAAGTSAPAPQKFAPAAAVAPNLAARATEVAVGGDGTNKVAVFKALRPILAGCQVAEGQIQAFLRCHVMQCQDADMMTMHWLEISRSYMTGHDGSVREWVQGSLS